MDEIEIRVLMDNNTYIDQYYLGEPAVSYYIEADGCRILFDTGYSQAFITNAGQMGIPLEEITHLVFSHGHNDHTRGFYWLEKQADLKKVEIIAHPECFNPKLDDSGLEIGSPLREDKVKKAGRYRPSGMPYRISDKCIFLGEIPARNDFEIRSSIGTQKIRSKWERDYVMDDSALALKTEEGLFIVTGCSHSGICNIVEYAMEVCGERRIAGILGGFHLFETDSRLEKTVEYLAKLGIKSFYPCNCVSFRAKARMNETLPVEEVGVGLAISLK